MDTLKRKKQDLDCDNHDENNAKGKEKLIPTQKRKTNNLLENYLLHTIPTFHRESDEDWIETGIFLDRFVTLKESFRVEWTHPPETFVDVCVENNWVRLLQWGRSQQNPCPWSEVACDIAARTGNLPMLQWLVGEGCPLDFNTVMNALIIDDVEILQFLFSCKIPYLCSFRCSVLEGPPKCRAWLNAGNHDRWVNGEFDDCDIKPAKH